MMKQKIKAIPFTMTVVFMLLISISSISTARDYYQLKIYTLKDKQQEATVESYLKDAYIPAMHRAGVKKVGVFKPIEDDQEYGKKIFVFVPIKKLDDIVKLEEKLEKDKTHLSAGANYIDAAHDNPPYERIQIVLLKAFKAQPEYFVPTFTTPKKEQIYELRSYEGASEKIWKKKVEMFDEAGEVELFEKLDFNAVFYGEVIAGAAMPNLMYMTTFENTESQKKHWDSFRNHPEWLKMKDLKEYKNTVSHMDKWLMYPTDYSDI